MVTFRVPDMTCGHCAGTIAKAITAEDAGARVEVDVRQQLVRVESESASAAELEFAIREAGYSPATVEAPPVRRAGGCCCARTKTVDLRQAVTPSQGACCG